ncbi:MAG TPA: glycosyltransferase, partial [Micavibrio sp.]
YKRIKQLINDYAPDSIHIATEGPLGWAARRYCLKHDRRFSTAYHTMFPDYIAKRAARNFKSLYNPARAYGIHLVRKFHNPASVLITTTPSITRILSDWGVRAPMVDIPRGVPLADFHPEGPAVDDAILSTMKKPIALYVGRVAIEKNIEAFLDMDWPGSKIVIGHGPSLTHFQALHPAVTFTGKITGPELAQWYRSADIFAFPSKTDTFGIVLIEALSCGLPVAALPEPGPRDIITTPLLGALDPDLSTAASKALQAIGTKEQRHNHIAQNYTWDAFTERALHAFSTHDC